MEDLFFHASAINGVSIEDHSRVEFEASEGPKGAVAVKVRLID